MRKLRRGRRDGREEHFVMMKQMKYPPNNLCLPKAQHARKWYQLSQGHQRYYFPTLRFNMLRTQEDEEGQ